MATLRLPATVLRSSGAWPCTSALGLRTRRYSAERSKLSPLSKLTVRVLRSLRSRSSVGQGEESLSIIHLPVVPAHKGVCARLRQDRGPIFRSLTRDRCLWAPAFAGATE